MRNSAEKVGELLVNMQAHRSELAKLLKEINSHWVHEDLIYRFYHGSFKVYALQSHTRRIVAALQSIAPSGTAFCPIFEEIYLAGTSEKQFKIEHNKQ